MHIGCLLNIFFFFISNLFFSVNFLLYSMKYFPLLLFIFLFLLSESNGNKKKTNKHRYEIKHTFGFYVTLCTLSLSHHLFVCLLHDFSSSTSVFLYCFCFLAQIVICVYFINTLNAYKLTICFTLIYSHCYFVAFFNFYIFSFADFYGFS